MSDDESYWDEAALQDSLAEFFAWNNLEDITLFDAFSKGFYAGLKAERNYERR